VLLVYQPAALKRMHTQLMSWQSWLEGTIGGPGRWCLVFYSRLAAGRDTFSASRGASYLPARATIRL